MIGLVIAIALLAIGVMLTVRSNVEIAQANSQFKLPLLFGRFAVRPPPSALRRRLLGAVAVLAGAWQLLDVLWDVRPGWALVVFTLVAVAGCLLPPLFITVRHNRNRPVAGAQL